MRSSSAAIVCSASRWRIARMPTASAPRAVLLQVIDKDAFAGLDPEPLDRQFVDVGVRLVHPDLSGDHSDVEELLQQVAVVVLDAPGVGEQRGLQACRAGRAHGVDHRLERLHADEEAFDQAFTSDAEALCEAALEIRLGDCAHLELAQFRQCLRVLAEEVLHRLGIEALLLAKDGEALPHRVGEHPPEVEDERLVNSLWAHGRAGRYRPRATRGVVRRQCRGREAAAHLRADLRWALQPDLRGERLGRSPLGAAPPAARQGARQRP